MQAVELELLGPLVQFGAAGLIGWMWLTERRAASLRERQLSAAHDRLLEQRVQLEQLMAVVSENTRAMAAVESSQRLLVDLLARVSDRIGRNGGGASSG